MFGIARARAAATHPFAAGARRRAVVFGGGAGAPRVVGHRGGRGEGWPPENTIAAFARACAEGADAIELDARACATGEPIVLHDADLARVTGGMDRRRVERMALGELRRVRLGAAREPVPTLAEVLSWARGRVAVNLEMKHDVPDRLAFARAVGRLLREGEVEVLISSFDPVLLALMVAIAPRTPRAWLTHEGQRRWARAWQPIAARAPIAAVHLERTQASPRAIARLHDAGLRVGVWTVNDPAEARDLADLGVDWIVTDAPARVGDAIRTRPG